MRPSRRTIIILTASAAAIAAAGYLAGLSMERRTGPKPQNESATPAVQGHDIGQAPPDVVFDGLDGGTVSLADLKGSAIMLDFWAAWCPFCRTEFPAMEEAYARHRDQGFVIIAVHRSATESTETAREFAAETGVTFPIVLDTTDDAYAAFSGVPAMPVSVFIDRHGVIRDKIYGPKRLETIEAKILEIL